MIQPDYNIADRLPESLDRENLQQVAQVIDDKLHELNMMAELVSIYPRIDELSSAFIDALAIQLHVDFYDTTFPLDKRRALVKNSVRWHLRKGTKSVVEELVSTVFDTSEVKEWYEYGGDPYYFKVVTEYVTTDRAVLNKMRQAIDSVKNARSWLDKIEFMLHLSDDAEMTENFMLNMQSVMAEDYPWPARTFDGTWALGGPRYIDGTWILDGTVGLNGVDGTAYALDSDIENLVLSGICFRGLVDDFGRTGQELNGLWNLDGENTLGNDALPLDANGMITVKRVRYLDGSWRLNGGDINYINGSMYLDGRFDLAGGGNRLNCETWTDILDGGKVIKRPEKIIPYDLLHPALEDNMDNIGEDVSLIKRLCGINLDDSTMRPIELDEGLPLDGALQLGDNITPFEAETNLEVRKAHRLNGQWVLDGGDLLMLDGVFYLDGTEMLSERGNRLEISRECIHF